MNYTLEQPLQSHNVTKTCLRLLLFLTSILCFVWPENLEAKGDEYNRFERWLLREHGEVKPYKYGSTWWREHPEDPYNVLLLHFGKPKPYPLEELAEKLDRKREKKAERTAWIDKALRAIETNSAPGVMSIESKEMNEDEELQAEMDSIINELKILKDLPPVKEPKVPTDTIYDYSYTRRAVPVGDIPGVSFTPDGKFGSAIRFDGTGPGVKFFKGQDNNDLSKQETFSHYNYFYCYIEFWIKVDTYPEKNACIFSSGGGEGRLMLRPDGKLDMVRLHPHGAPKKRLYRQWGREEGYEKIFDLPTALVSDRPLPLNEWTHVTVWRGQTAITNMQLNYIWINGEEVANSVGSPHDHYNMFSNQFTRDHTLVIGNDHAGEHPFSGEIDDFRIPKGGPLTTMFGTPSRHINPEPPDYEWRDTDADRPLDFGRPYFYRDGTVFHLGFEDGLTINSFVGDSWEAELTNPIDNPERLLTDGIRGKSMIVDPKISLLRIPIDGKLDMAEGSVEFWMSPLNWDDAASRPKNIPTLRINTMRMHCEMPDGRPLSFPIKRLPNRRGEGEFSPGHWSHFVLTWKNEKPTGPVKKPIRGSVLYRVYRNHDKAHRKAKEINAKKTYVSDPEMWLLPFKAYKLKPLYLEVGIEKKAIGADGNEPIILLDEVVGYDYELAPPEVIQAQNRVKGRLEPFRTLNLSVKYKYGIHELTGTITSLFPPQIDAEKITVTVLNEDGSEFAPPITQPIGAGEKEGTDRQKGDIDRKTHFLFSKGEPPPAHKPLRFHTQVFNADGEKIFEDDRLTWTYKPETWRGNDLGVPKTTPAPWTPVEVDDNRFKTLMTEYEIGANGLPARIVAKGENLLARPFQLLEDGKPMKAKRVTIGESQDVKANWTVHFKGNTCDLKLNGRVEFDGLTRYEIDIKPKREDGIVAPVRLEIPMKNEYATHRIFQRFGGITKVQKDGPDVFSSRRNLLARAQWRAKRANRRRHKVDVPTNENFEAWDFWPIMDLCNRDRGLYWFADTGAGWGQSKKLPAQEFQREGDEHRMVLHLVADSGEYEQNEPIVFGVIPHPAKPLPEDYRYFERAASPQDPNIHETYGAAFAPLPRNVKQNMMSVYPKNRSWEQAESNRIYIDMMKPFYRTMYLSLAWFSCRKGGYDNWAWRNGDSSKVSLTDSFVEYLCWEMDEWLKRGIFNAIYLDECYAWEISGKNAIKAGQAIRMPDGTMQPGLRQWHFRKLMKRWYTLSEKYGDRPMILPHHSRYWMYPGKVFATSTLDGESFPLVTKFGNRNFMEKLDFERFEVINNPGLWGTVSFYMPSIWERGPRAKGDNPHPAWSWRMARGAQAIFAHMETGTVFVDQGGSVYNGYSNILEEWGALPPDIEFVPYYKIEDEIQLPPKEKGKSLVSYYRDASTNRVLMIITNRTKEERPIQLKLDFAKLGLSPQAEMTVRKGSYARPEGIDPWEINVNVEPDSDVLKEFGMKQDTNADLQTNLADDIPFESAETVAARKKRLHQPKFDKAEKVLRIPVRAHDFRMISFE